MIIEVAKLPDDPLFLDLQVPRQELKFTHQDVRLWQDVELRVRITKMEAQTIRVEGNCSTVLEFVCSRCLRNYTQPQQLRFDLYYMPNASIPREVEEIELKDEDMELGFYDGVRLDTHVILSEQLVFAIPMKPLCRNSCLGLCPQCGADRNVNPCGCQPVPQSRMQEKLLELKKHLEDRKK